MKTDTCDNPKCGLTIGFGNHVLLPEDTPIKAEGRRRIAVKVICQHCKHENPRVVDLTKEHLERR
jgi:hypothetical protein